MYTLHNLHPHPIGIQVFILALKITKLREYFISLGTIAQVLGPLNEIVSVP